MAQNDLPGLESRPLLDVPREDRADRALIQAYVAEGVPVDGCLGLESLDLYGLGHDDEDVGVSHRPSALHRPHHVVAGHRDLRNQDEVRAAGESAERGDPAGIATHRLDDDHAMVRARCRPQTVECVRDHGDGGVEADAELGLRKVVVDGLGHTDDADALLMEPVRDAERVVPADGDERVELRTANGSEDAAARGLVFARVGPRGAEDRATVTEDAGDLAHAERPRQVFSEEAGPAVGDTEDLVTERVRAHDDGADRRVQPRCVASSGEDTDPHPTSGASATPAAPMRAPFVDPFLWQRFPARGYLHRDSAAMLAPVIDDVVALGVLVRFAGLPPHERDAV